MKKVLLSLVVIVSFAGYVYIRQTGNLPAIVTANPGSSTVTQTGNSGSQTPPAASPPPATATQSGWKDGKYTGDSVDAFYGFIRVRATILSGRIVDIEFLEYPNDRNQSIEINERAMPRLEQEAITKQSANVNIVSGATDSALAFSQSLMSALRLAAQ